mmetsp:Transcript_67562/g.197729  ORF Transcript_67562/g.197729 Transcript_67562/m.197729 type:complete len:436 (-) Transcript_67562:129-1436(-)
MILHSRQRVCHRAPPPRSSSSPCASTSILQRADHLPRDTGTFWIRPGIGGTLFALALRSKCRSKLGKVRPTILHSLKDGSSEYSTSSQAQPIDESDGQNAVVVDLWQVFGDVIATSLIAPLLAVFLARVQIYTPTWLALIGETERGFVFPEFAHGAGFTLCWLLGGCLTGLFTKAVVDPKDRGYLASALRFTGFTGVVATSLVVLMWMALSKTGTLLECYAAMGFQTLGNAQPSALDLVIDCQVGSFCLVVWRFTRAVARTPLEGYSGEEDPAASPQSEIVDNRLVLGDLLIAGAVVPALIVVCFFQTGVYTPGWVALWGAAGESAASAALAHGAVLASCWVLGAWLTGGFGADAVNRRNLPGTLKKTWIAGGLATVFLALSAGLNLYISGVRLDGAMDFDASRRLVQSMLDLILDVQSSALCLTTWRLWWAGLL